MHTDKPTSTKSEDRFQRYEFSKRIASIIATPKNDKSLIVGLYGKWGEGKTSVMNFVQQELPQETIIVNFNPWMFSEEQYLLRSFFASISKELGARDKTIKEKIGGFLSDYSGAIGSVTQFAGFGTDGLEKLGDKLKETSIEHLKKKVDDLIVESGKNIVVFVDDIDRLDIPEIQYVFKLVKLVGDFPRTAYVLSFDDEMVAAALAPKYGGDNKAAGYNFLEKIIQIPLKIPKASQKALFKYTTDLLNSVLTDTGVELHEEEVSDFTEAFNTAFLPFMDNPRIAIRYANALAFSVPLLKGEVNIGNLLVIEGIKIFHPQLYDFIRSNADLFTRRVGTSDYGSDPEERKEVELKLLTAIGIYTKDRQSAIVLMLQELFPQLRAVFDDRNFPDQDYMQSTKARKICSTKYFNRYFSYTVQEGDMPDTYFDQLLANLQNNSIEHLVMQFTQAAELYDIFDLVQKFRMRENELNQVQSENLATVLARIGHSFPVEEDTHFATTYSQSASLIARLIRNIVPDKRLSFILKLFSTSPSLEYAMEIHYWLIYRGKNDSNTGILSDNDERKMQHRLVTLFRQEMTDSNFFDLISDRNLWRILTWWSTWAKEVDALKAYLNQHLGEGKNHEFALRLLKVFTPTINASSFRLTNKKVIQSSYKSGFKEDNFDALGEVVDVNQLNKNLVSFYGDRPHGEGPSVISDRDPIDDKTLVSTFQWFVKNKPL